MDHAVLAFVLSGLLPPPAYKGDSKLTTLAWKTQDGVNVSGTAFILEMLSIVEASTYVIS